MVPKLVATRPTTKEDDLSQLPLDIVLRRLVDVGALDELKAIKVVAVDCLRKHIHAA